MKKVRLFALFVFAAMMIAFAGFSPATVDVASAGPVAVTLQESTATASQPQSGLFVAEAVDGIVSGSTAAGLNGWATFDGNGIPGSNAHTAVWETASDVNASQLDFNLYHTWCCAHSLGRFRLSYTTDDRSLFADGVSSGGDVTANWIVLTGATTSGTGGETFTELADNSILVSGPAPETTVYSVSFAGSFSGITGIRLEALTDPSLPTDGPGRATNGNWHLVEITLAATIDTDGDGFGDAVDDCPFDPDNDIDGDGVCGDIDNAPNVYNPGQIDSDFDGVGDVADACPLDPDNDFDGDGVCGDVDNAPNDFNPGQIDSDFDGLGDVADACPFDPDNDFDGDGVCGDVDAFPNDATESADSDGDGVGDNSDAFPNDATRAVSCDPGYYGAFDCAPAPLGRFVATYGALTAQLCSAGTFSDQLASIACTPAPAGTFVDFAGAAEATACSPGYYQDLEGQTSCTAAPIGFYVPDSGSVAATACPAGSTTAGIASTSLADCNFPPTADAGGPYLVEVGEQISFISGLGTDDPDGDILTEVWTADGGTVAGNVYTAGSVPGIYDVELIVNDGTVDSQPATTMVVVYDPSGGFVTGGGWIDSPVNAEYQYMQAGGKASFGFVAKYKKGANVPDGNTQFQYRAGDLDFHSTSYEWLVVAGNMAQFKGEGTINGVGSYTFMISADDDNPDTFRIKIWDDDEIVYDNGSQQALGGGSIRIHN